jgi:C2 domain
MSFIKSGIRARGLALLGFLLAVFPFIDAISADAHPHRKHKRHYSQSDNSSGSSSRDVELTVTIHQLIALDKGDAFSSEDFYARVTIGGQVFKSERIRQTDAVIPNWKFSAIVPNGRTDVKIEVFDKDIVADDQIDINRIDPKRDLDFVVNTRSCRLEGFAQAYKCGNDVRRSGGERKKAEMVFMVTVK